MKTKTLAILLVMAFMTTGCRLIAASQQSATPQIIEQETAIPIETVSQPIITSTPIINAAEPIVVVPQPVIEAICTVSETSLSTHVVGAGDTLTTIASRYNVTADTLIQMNCLDDADNLQIGQVLFVPSSNQPVVEFDDTDSLPALGGNGEAPQQGCFVERNIGINDVFVHHDGSSIPVAKLGSYLPLESVVRNAYLVTVEGFPNNIGWVWQDVTHLVGDACGLNNTPPSQPVEPPMIIPAYGYQNEPPATECSAIQNANVETAFIYGTPEAFNTRIGRLSSASWLPIVGVTSNGFTVALSDGRTAWMPANDILLVGTDCPTN